MSSQSQFTPIVGPLGLWNFPIVNMIRQVLWERRRAQASYTGLLEPKSGPRETMENLEAWKILRDEKGRMVGLEIHRSVKEVE